MRRVLVIGVHTMNILGVYKHRYIGSFQKGRLTILWPIHCFMSLIFHVFPTPRRFSAPCLGEPPPPREINWCPPSILKLIINNTACLHNNPISTFFFRYRKWGILCDNGNVWKVEILYCPPPSKWALIIYFVVFKKYCQRCFVTILNLHFLCALIVCVCSTPLS